MKRFAWICLLLAGLLMIAGCDNSAMSTLSDTGSESQTVLSSVGKNTEAEDSASETKETPKPTDSESISESESSEPAEKEEPVQTEKPDTGAVAVDEKPEEREETSSSSRNEEPIETTPPVTESKSDESSTTPPQPTETPKPTEPPKKPEPTKEPESPVNPETEPSEEPTPPLAEEKPKEPEQPSEPAFDVNYWVDYAKGYAQSLGLTLSSWAVECWDNPIPAAAYCTNIAEDIQGYLNRYAKSGEVTDVWIWAESLGNNQYQIYIGYA